ncbi:Uu.00g146070.m01.CDS01 [Anthostomella pinea]|uniref:glucan 1,3-beta-glucosidase n=1 Tax=Anthostomella pinea TaxID=933095 RepID=A0AAI8VR42_9PEZI|nr:Uu.00g146070.m01.CDS01 [Anthostomella pinea]
MSPLHFLKSAAIAASMLASVGNAAPHGPMSLVKKDLKFAFGSEKIRGVNLGGWLVLEPWITPSIFQATPDNVVDEYTLTKTLGAAEASTRLESHWSSWITAADFTDMHSKGINFVRIPVGYWSVTPLDGDPYVSGGYKYLGQALDWAQSASIKVMIDLHGAPGSQNGLDNSGRRGAISWTQGDTVQQTLGALTKLRNDFSSHAAVAAIELINEPMSPQLNMDTVRQFMVDGLGTLQNSNVAVAFHDAFLGPTAWNDWGAASAQSSLLLDTHHYEVFDAGQLQMSTDQHIASACGFGQQLASSNKWAINGEFSGAMTDCATWLNGRGVGARYDGTFNYNGASSSYIGSCAGKSNVAVAALAQSERDNIANFLKAQMVAYEKADGWIFWTWKTESAPEWDFQELSNAGVIPQLGSWDTSICG